MILSRDPVFRLPAVLLALCAIPSFGWAGAKPSVDPNTPEGRLLEKVQAESDLSKRMVLLELFPELFPASSAAEYVWSELQARYLQAGKLDKALAAGSNVLISNPNNLQAACVNWRIAADMKDSALTAVWMKQAGNVAERALKTPDPDMSKATRECGASARQANETEAYQGCGHRQESRGPAQIAGRVSQDITPRPSVRMTSRSPCFWPIASRVMPPRLWPRRKSWLPTTIRARTPCCWWPNPISSPAEIRMWC